MGKSSSSGRLLNNDAVWALSFEKRPDAFPDLSKIYHVDLEIMQNGKTRKHRFEKHNLPPNMLEQSGYGHSYIKVTDTDFVVGAGSGNWGSNFKSNFGLLLLFPCGALTMIALVVYLSKQKRKNAFGGTGAL
jgi:hypothetical protein